jgi:hypothetical protein
MYEYMEETHPDAFLDFPPPRDVPEGHVQCNVCKGHGGWNLRINAYPLHNYEDTPENRHRFSHFRCACSHCSGWGFHEESLKCPRHQWEEKTIGRCLHLWTCKICGAKREVDSSD